MEDIEKTIINNKGTFKICILADTQYKIMKVWEVYKFGKGIGRGGSRLHLRELPDGVFDPLSNKYVFHDPESPFSDLDLNDF